MNSWKLNSTANYYYRLAISKSLGISLMNVYKTVKTIHSNGVVEIKGGKKYEVVLKEIEE